MEIKKGNFHFKGPLTPLDLQKVNSIALHHMDHLTADEYEVEKWHLQRETNGQPWLGFAYNYWIGFDGRVIEGRGLNQGAGVEGQNGHILSIGFQGDYDKSKEIPKEQYDAGVWLIHKLKQMLGKELIVDGHHRWNNTSCPGRYFPLAQMINEKFVEVKGPETIPDKSEVTGLAFADARVSYNGKEVVFTDAKPININGRVYVPIRQVIEAMGKIPRWNDEKKMVEITDLP